MTPTETPFPLLHVAPATLLSLRAQLLSRADLDTVFALRDAGYASGDAVYSAFEAFVRDTDGREPMALDLERFFLQAGDFFTAAGWGETVVSAMDDTFCVVEISGCWEAASEHQPDPKGCHLTVGMLGAFLGKFADYPVSILEIEGPGTGSDYCRFIAGNTTMIADYYAKHS